jgi:hypothetical protein
MMRLQVNSYYATKAGNSATEWEDACGHSEQRGLAAVSDGASSSYRARQWAVRLTEDWIERPSKLDPQQFESWVHHSSQRMGAASGPDDGGGGETAWYVGEAERRGSFATFLGVRFSKSATRAAWNAIAVGDTCLFHVRGGDLLRAFPLSDPDEFSTTPPLLSSEQYRDSHGGTQAVCASGDLEPGDIVLLATDALSEGALLADTHEQPIWKALSNVSHQTFDSLVSSLRDACLVKNDDVTLVRCIIEAADS